MIHDDIISESTSSCERSGLLKAPPIDWASGCLFLIWTQWNSHYSVLVPSERTHRWDFFGACLYLKMMVMMMADQLSSFMCLLWIPDVRIFLAQSPVCECLWCAERGIMGGRRAVNHCEGVGVISLSCCRSVLDGISLLAVFQGDWQRNNVWGPQRAPAG